MSFKRQAITLAKTTLTTWTSSKLFLLLIILQVAKMITTSKDGWCNESDAEILNSLKDWVSRCDVKYVKSDALKKIDSAFALWGGGRYVEAVHLLEENKVFLEKSDWPYYALGIQILRARKHEFFNE
mgnify:FL=1|jgi:hypothetical protein